MPIEIRNEITRSIGRDAQKPLPGSVAAPPPAHGGLQRVRDRVIVIAPSAMIGQGIADILRGVRPELQIDHAARAGLTESDVQPDVRLVVQCVRDWPDPAAEAPRAWLERVPVMLLVPRPDALVEAAARRAGYVAVVPFTERAVAVLAKASEILDGHDQLRRAPRAGSIPAPLGLAGSAGAGALSARTE